MNMPEQNGQNPTNPVPTGSILPYYIYAYPLGTVSVVPSEYIGNLDNIEEPDWIIPGFLAREGLTLFYGYSGSFKTTVVIYMAYNLQIGGNFFGIPIDKPYRVLLIEQDESLAFLKGHIDTIGLKFKPELPLQHVYWDEKQKDFNQEFAIALAVSKADVVFIDSYTSLGVTDITRPESGLVFDALRRYSTANKCSICIIHHPSAAGNPMGSTLHVAKVDVVIKVNKLQEDTNLNTAKIELVQEKARGTQYEPLTIDVVDKKKLQLQKTTTNLKDEVLQLCAAGWKDEQILDKFPKQKYQTIKKYIWEYKKNHPGFGGLS